MKEFSLADNTRIRVSSEQVSVDLDGEAAILDLKSGTYFGLNPVGARIWSLIKDTPRTFGELRHAIVNEYEVTFEQCDVDVRELLQQLHQHGLIEIVDELPT